MKHLKRVLPLVLALAMVCSTILAPMQVAASGYTGSVVSTEGMHPFTGTENLIREAVAELLAQGKTATEKEEDKQLVEAVEAATNQSFDQVKAGLVGDLFADMSKGVLDVSDLNLDKADMADLFEGVLYDSYLNHALTDVTYNVTAGKVTSISFGLTEGYSAALDAMQTEELTVAVAPEARNKAVLHAAISRIPGSAELMAEGDEEEEACAHVVSCGTSADYNSDEVVDITDITTYLTMFVNDEAVDDYDGNGNIEINDVVKLLQMFVDDEVPEGGAPSIVFEYAPVADSTPIFSQDASGNYLDSNNEIVKGDDGNPIKTPYLFDASGNVVGVDQRVAVLNGGLLYDAETNEISTGILPDIYHGLTKITFECSVCGEEVVIDDPETLANSQMKQDIWLDMTTYEVVAVNYGEKPYAADATEEEISKWLHYTEYQIFTYFDASTVWIDTDGDEIPDSPMPEMDAEGNVVVDENGNPVIPGMYVGQVDNGPLEVNYYYNVLSSFNAGNAEYLGVSADYWTSKNTESNPMAALKSLCNMDPNMDVPPAAMLQMVQMLPQAFMAYVYYYGAELLAMRDAAMAAVDALPSTATDVQKLLVLHDWLAENAVFDMGSMLNVGGSGQAEMDPIQMTTFGTLLSSQLTAMTHKGYYGAICLGYAAGFTYLVQNAFPDVYKIDRSVYDEDGNLVEIQKDAWCTPKEVDALGGDIVDFGQVMFYTDTAESSIAGEGFGGGIFNNVHYWNMVRLDDAPTSTNADDNMTGNWFFVDACYDDIYVECLAQYRAEADGSVYHSYFLVSPETMAKLWGDSIDYIDHLYDGVTYYPQYQMDENGNVVLDANGNPVPAVISDNVSEDSENYDPTHPEYATMPAEGETASNNTCYEDTWFSGVISKIYNDGTNWYYVDSGTNSTSFANMMDENGEFDFDMDQMEDQGMDADSIMHSSRVDIEMQDKLKSRPMTAPDYWVVEEDDSGDDMFAGFDVNMTTKEDPNATVLFDYGTGKFSKNEALDLSAAAKADFLYNEQYPSLTHSLGLYSGKLYFNLGNQIYTYTLADNTLALLKEYNKVSASSDGRVFTASSYTVDPEGTALVVENNPIAALVTKTAYTPLYDYIDAEGKVVMSYDGKLGSGYTYENFEAAIVGQVFRMMAPAETLTVNIGTNYSFTAAFKDGMTDDEMNASRYTVEAINYNPDFTQGMSDEGVNKNEEFLWCANIREDLDLASLASDTEVAAYTQAATCTTDGYTENRTAKFGLSSGERTYSETDLATGHDYVYNTDEGCFICETCKLHALNVLVDDENMGLSMSAVAESGLGDMAGSFGDGDNVTQPVDPEREAAVKKTGEITIVMTEADEEALKRIDGVQYISATAAEGTEPTVIAKTEDNEDGTYVLNKTTADALTISPAYALLYTITVESVEGEVVIDSGEEGVAKETAEEKETIEFEVEPEAGYKIVSVKLAYTVDDTSSEKTLTASDEGVYSFEMPAADVTITATYEAIPYNVTVQDGVTLNEDIPATDTSYTVGTEIALGLTEAAAADHEGQTVVFKVNDNNGNPIPVTEDNTFIMPASPVSVFYSWEWNIEVEVTGAEIEVETTDLPEHAAAETKLTFTVVPEEGYKVVSVTAGENVLTADADTKAYTVTMPAAVLEITIEVKAIDYKITVAEGVTLKDKETTTEGEDTYYIGNIGEVITLEVAPVAGRVPVFTVKDSEGNNVTVKNTEGVYTFVMPASDVTVELDWEFDITKAATENGKFAYTVDEETKLVTVTVTPNEGYEVGTVSVTKTSGTVETTNTDTGFTFTMPDEAVTISVTFKKVDYTVTVTAPTNGTVTADKATANIGDTVTVTVTPADGYEIDAITVTKADSTAVTVTKGETGYTFTMPAGNVTITVTFKAVTTTPETPETPAT